MTQLKNFVPSTTTSVSATTSSARALVGAGPSVRLYNAGSATVFVAFGTDSVTATTSDMPVPAGTIEVLERGANTHLAALTASGTATLYVTAGLGS